VGAFAAFLAVDSLTTTFFSAGFDLAPSAFVAAQRTIAALPALLSFRFAFGASGMTAAIITKA
jgi:hypothetical protein